MVASLLLLTGPLLLAYGVWTGKLWEFLARDDDDTFLYFIASRAASIFFILLYCVVGPYLLWFG